MADFVAVLRRAIDSLDNNTPEARAALYDKARGALMSQLRALDPPLSEEELAQQAEGLDLAIARLEEEYSGAGETHEETDLYAGESGGEPESEPEPDREAEEEAEEVGSLAAAEATSNRTAGRPSGAPAPSNGGQQRPVRPSRPAEAPTYDTPAYDPSHMDSEPPRGRRGRKAIWGIVALLVLIAALFGLWQSGVILDTGAPGDQVADEEKIDDRVAQPQEQPDQPQFEAPAEPETQAPEPGTQVPEPEQETAQPEEEVVPPPATAEQPSLTDQPTPPGASAQALLIEEATGTPGSANTLGGSVQWELVEENGAQGQGQAISGTVTIPDRDFGVVITIRRNTDTDLPASHTIEIVFDLPSDFAGEAIANVPGMIMKATPRSTGQPLVGAVVPVTDNFFLVGLSESDIDRQRNVREMLQRDFMDIPLVYESGGRAVLSIAKGEEGQQVFQQAFDAWQQ